MKFILDRVSGESIDNPEEFKWTHETKEIDLNTIQELIELMTKYNNDCVIFRPDKIMHDPKYHAYRIRLYDDYLE